MGGRGLLDLVLGWKWSGVEWWMDGEWAWAEAWCQRAVREFLTLCLKVIFFNVEEYNHVGQTQGFFLYMDNKFFFT